MATTKRTSDMVLKGPERAPHRSLLYALGLSAEEMKQVLTEIQDGTFASEFLTEMSPKGGRQVHFLAKRRMEADLLIEKVGKELRGMMSWLKK